MPSWISSLRLIGFIDPHTCDLAWCSDGYIYGDCKAHGACGVEIAGEPAEEGWDASLTLELDGERGSGYVP